MDDSTSFPALAVSRKTGAEPFHISNAPLGFDLLSFWQWATSNVTNNVLRGWLAEYIVARALGVADQTRVEWDGYDLTSTRGLKVEVKSAAYLQSWAQKEGSKIKFDIAAKCGWNTATNAFEPTARRQADVYVFALLHHREKTTLDPLNVDQWTFFVLATSILNATVPGQQKIGLPRLLTLKPVKAAFAALRDTIERTTITHP